MPRAETLTENARRSTLRSVRRACYAGLGSVELRREVGRRLLAAIPADAWTLTTTDPETGLFTHVIGDGLPTDAGLDFATRVYPHDEASRLIALGRSRQIVAAAEPPGHRGSSPFHSTGFYQWLDDAGLEAETRAAFATGDELWGTACLMRERRASGFTPGQLELFRRAAPHIARGLRSGALIDQAAERDAAPESPGVIVLEDDVRVLLVSATAAKQLEDLADLGVRAARVPVAVASVVDRLRSVHASADAAADDNRPLDATLHARGRSGRWYVLHASLAETGGAERVSVIIRGLTPAEKAPLLARLYGLTEREREVLALAARGESTRRIARSLGISPYTVQDHLGHACDKVGVRGRKRLLAKIFFDGYLPGLAGPRH